MWIQKVIIFVLLCIESNQNLNIESYRFERDTNDPDLLLVYKDFAKLGRIINAISLQSLAIQKSIKIRDVITELLKINTESFSTLVKNDLSHYLPILEDLRVRSIDLSRAMTKGKKSSVEKVKVLNKNLNTIKQLSLFSSAGGASTDDLFKFVSSPKISKMLIVCDTDVVKITRDFYDLLNTKNLQTILLNERQNKKTISDIKSYTKTLKDCMNNFKTYNQTVNSHFERVYEPFNQMEIARKSIEEFDKISIDFKTFLDNVNIVTGIVRDTEDKMKGLGPDKIGEMLRRGMKHLETISNWKNTPSRSLTVGFRNIEDLEKVRSDLNSEWFKRKISKGKSVDDIEKNLREFFKFGEMMKTLKESCLKFQSLVEMSQEILKKTIEKAELIENHVKIKQGFFDEFKRKFEKCYKDSNFNKNRYKDFDETSQMIQQIRKVISNIATWSEKTVNQIDSDPLDVFLNSLKSLDDAASLEDSLTKIKGYSGYDTFFRFSEGFEALQRKQSKIPKTFDAKAIQKASDGMPAVEAIFSKSSVRDISNCLTTETFDPDTMASSIEYITSVLDIEHFGPTEELFRQFLIMRHDLIAIEEPVKELGLKVNISERSLILKLEKPQEIALTVGRGVDMIYRMATAFQKQKLLLEATKYNKEVDESIQKSNPNEFVKKFWLNPSKPITHFLQELNVLNKFAGKIKNQELLKMKEIFMKALKVDGFPEVFSHVHSQLSSYNFTDKEKIRSVQNSKELSELHLDFSTHKGYLPAASLSIGNIKSYFDDVFDLAPKASKRRTWENAYGLVVGISTFLFLICVMTVLMAYGFTGNGRRKYKKWYLYYYPRKDEFEKRWRYSLFRDRVDGKNALLDAVREINAQNVLKAVRKGVYISAFTRLGNTALHVATKRGYPEIVEILIKHGADRKILNVENKTAEQMIPSNYRETHKEKTQRFSKIERIYKKYQKKKFRLQVPDVFPTSSFHIYVEGRTNDTITNSFTEKFQSITSDEILATTTHCVVKTEKGNHLETDDLKLLLWIFSGVIVMKDTWMTDCLEDENNIHKDYEYLVEDIKYKNVMYNTIVQWTNSIAKGSIPYLHGVYVAVVVMGYENIALLSNIVITHGGKMLDKFPEKDAYNIGSRPYLHADTPPLFIIHDGTINLDVYKNDPDKMYTLFTEEEFIGFMLKRETKINTKLDPIPVAIDRTIE